MSMAKSKSRGTRRIGNRVPMTVATNPVARAIERTNTERAEQRVRAAA